MYYTIVPDGCMKLIFYYGEPYKLSVANTNNTIVYFSSKDCVTEEASVENAGGKIIRSKMPIGEFGFVTMPMDTERNTIGLHSRKYCGIRYQTCRQSKRISRQKYPIWKSSKRKFSAFLIYGN